MADLRQIISGLALLTPADRKKVRAALDHLEGSRSIVTVTKANTDDWLGEGLLYELSRRGLTYPGFSENRIAGMAPNYAADSAALRTSLRLKLLNAKAGRTDARLNHAELIAFGRVAARCLAEFLQPIGPIGLKFLFSNVSKIPDAIEASFPDYLASGMVWLLVQPRGK